MKRLIVLSVILLLPFSARSQIDNTQSITKTGTTAGQFLKIGTDARATGMGGAFTAMPGDLSSMHWNPAGLSYLTGLEATFLHSNWLAEMDFNYFAFAFEIEGLGVLGAGITALTVPEDKVRTVWQPEGTGELFSASDLAINLSFSRQLTDRFSIGGSVRYVRQTIWHSSANGVAFDIGALFVTPFNNVRLGAAILNYGSDMRMDGRDLRFSYDPDPDNQGNVEFVNALYETEYFPLPLVFRVGLAGEVIKTENTRMTLGIDALHPNDNSESINTGAEIAFRETFFLRAGYATLFRKDTEEGLTFGAGIHYRLWGSSTLLKFDYSYADFGLLQNVQRFSIGIRF